MPTFAIDVRFLVEVPEGREGPRDLEFAFGLAGVLMGDGKVLRVLADNEALRRLDVPVGTRYRFDWRERRDAAVEVGYDWGAPETAPVHLGVE